MEEVWNSITHHHNRDQQYSRSHHSHSTIITARQKTPMRGMVLQDFLAGPQKQTTATSTPETPSSMVSDAALHHPPATILSLNSCLNFVATPDSSRYQAADDDGNHRPLHHPPPPSPFTSNIPFVDAVGFQDQPGIFSFCGEKRSSEQQQQMDGSAESGDRRRSRMIKNRQSAARSRARKQAYTNELEVLVRNLTEENNMLKKEYAKLKEVMAAQLPVKRTLLRTSTAPF